MSESRVKVSRAGSDDEKVGRRLVLRGVAVGSIGLTALAACGSDDGDDASDTGDTSAPSESPTSEAPTDGGDGGDGGGGDGGGGGGGEVLGATSDVPVGGGVIYTDQEIVVTQPTEGEFLGFTAICTHQSCVVGDVADGTINCPCHGSMYSIEDGSVVGGPATAPLAPENVSVQGQNVVLG